MFPYERTESHDKKQLLAALGTIIKAYEGAAADIALWREAKAAHEGAAPPERLRSILIDISNCYNGTLADSEYWRIVRDAIYRK